MVVRSVKGMTIGSPEFVKTVKAAEREAETTEIIADISNGVDKLLDVVGGFTAEQHADLIRIRRDLSEVLLDC